MWRKKSNYNDSTTTKWKALKHSVGNVTIID